MKQYQLTVCYPPGATQPPPEKLGKIIQDVNAVNEEMMAAGAWVFTGGLHPPSSATTVQVKEGELLITDGPFAEGKEHIGGICVINAEDLDAALLWARKLANAIPGVAIEVWPFQSQPGR